MGRESRDERREMETGKREKKTPKGLRVHVSNPQNECIDCMLKHVLIKMFK